MRGNVGHVHGTPRTVELVSSPHMVFELLEVGKHLAPCPAGIAGGAPVVEVCGLTPHVHHRVDRTGASEHFAAWPVGAAIRQCRIGFRLVHPVVARVRESPAITDGHLDPRAAVGAARFQQQHAVPAGFREAVGEHAARGTRADDHVVVLSHAKTLP